MIEIIRDISTFQIEARKHDPILAKSVTIYRHRSTFWRWLESDKLRAATFMLSRIGEMRFSYSRLLFNRIR